MNTFVGTGPSPKDPRGGGVIDTLASDEHPKESRPKVEIQMFATTRSFQDNTSWRVQEVCFISNTDTMVS